MTFSITAVLKIKDSTLTRLQLNVCCWNLMAESRIEKWFIEFETKRLADLDLPEDQRDSEMVAYQNAVGHSSDAIESLEYRNKILARDFFSIFDAILPLDDTREFGNEQKLAIFRRDKGLCQLKMKCAGRK